MKKYYLLATALAAMVSCTSDDYVGDNNLQEANGQAAISFNSGVGAITRADKTGAAAATDLNNLFIVYGEKNETSGSAPTTGNLVFQNYKVEYTASTAYATTSNTNDWEYVGLNWTDNEHGNITTSTTDEQTIKYWDFGASSYTFTAISALPADISAGDVAITKTTSGSTIYDKGYSVALKANANLDKLFFSERQPITASANTDRTQANKYGGNVTFRFHNAASKVRVAMYETIPGYSVTIKQFKVDNDAVLDNDAKPAFADMVNAVTDKFAANFKNVAKGTAGTLTVTYHDNSVAAIENHPILSFGATKNAVLNLGENLKATTVLGESATAATFDTADNAETTEINEDKAYTSVFPNETNEQNLKLKLDYTLTAPVTGETIEITDATAEIPAKYLQWKPGFAYTYIFKITDDKLYPITFDAVEVVAEDGTAEYITTVTEPSITTFAVVLDNTDKFKNYVTDKNDYQLPGGTDKLDIYATIMKGSTVQTPQTSEASKANYVKVYSVDYKDGATAVEKAEKPITELSVANAIEHTGGLITATEITSSNVSTYLTSVPAPVSSVPGEDGVNKTINALKLEGVKAAGKYAVEIVTYEAVTLTSGANLNGYYSVNGSGEYEKKTSGTYESGTYYKQVKTYKVITVAAAAGS